MMDALYKVYVEAQSTTMPIMALESMRVWSGKRAIESIDDISSYMNDYLLKAPKGQLKIDVPVKMFTDVIGSARLFDLVVEYETSEEAAGEGAEVKSIVEMIESLRLRVDELARRLGPRAEEFQVIKGKE
jgi:hypothetical protein